MSLYRRCINLSILAVGLTLLAGCGGGEKAPAATATGSTAPGTAPMVAGTALPSGYKIDPDRTLILGTDDRWTGRLSYTTSTNADDTFDFLRREMPNFGWSEMTAMRSDTSLLTFMSESTGRVATIYIARGSMLGGGVHVDMVVSPRDVPARSGAPTPARAPAH
jgi:hypothetical protein